MPANFIAGFDWPNIRHRIASAESRQQLLAFRGGTPGDAGIRLLVSQEDRGDRRLAP